MSSVQTWKKQLCSGGASVGLGWGRASEGLLWGVSAALNTLIPIQETLKMQCGLKAPSRINGL